MSDSSVRAGVQYDPRFDLGFAFTEQEQDYDGPETARVTGSEATVGVDQSPRDRAAATVRTYDKTAIVAALVAKFTSKAKRIRVDDLPAVLTGITSVISKSTGTGVDSHPTSQQGFSIVDTGSGGLSPRASSSGSASVQPSIAPQFKRFPRVVSGLECEIFISGSFTESNILTRLSAGLAVTVNAWPVFIEVVPTFILVGQQTSVTAKADTTTSLSASDAVVRVLAYEWGNGSNQEVGINASIVQFPPCIFGSITVSPSTDTATASASATANTAAYSSLPAITNATGSITKDATGSITPSSLSATTPAAVPSSGRYLYDYSIESVGYGVTRILAEVLDASAFA